MMTGRRRAAAAVLGLLALGGLSACQTDPAVAAYVDDAEIRTEQVDGVVDALRTSYEGELEGELDNLAAQEQIDDQQISEFRSEGRDEIDNRIADARDRVLMMLVLTEAATAYAETEDITAPEAPLSATAEEQQLPEDHPYVAVVADFTAVVGTVVQARAEPTEPTGEDQREVYDNLQLPGQELEEVPFEDVEPFLTVEALGGPVGVRDTLVDMLERVDVRVQPGFDLVYQVPVQLGNVTSFLAVQISEPTSVRDAG